MELKYEKKAVRDLVESKMKDVPEGLRISIDKEPLEDLLFDTITCNKETGQQVKLPVWSGEFLQKLDLSDVSFDNVAWSLVTDTLHDHDVEVFDRDTWEKFNVYHTYALQDGQMVDYSHTNANIDFSKSFEAQQEGQIKIIDCNFAGLDLSNNDMSKLGTAFYSDLSNTGIKLSPEMFPSRRNIFGDTNLSGVDLSNFTVNGRDLTAEDYSCVVDHTCNLSNTGINVSVSSEEMSSPIPGNDQEDTELYRLNFQTMLQNGYLDGCYINGQMVSPEVRKAYPEVPKTEAEQMLDDVMKSTAASIDQQINAFKGK